MQSQILSTSRGEFQICEINVSDLPLYPHIMENYTLTICHSGESSGSCNLRQCTIKKGVFSINMPGQIIHYEAVSQDFSCTAIMLSPTFMSSLGFPYNFEINRLIEANPVTSLSENEYTACLGYCRMVTAIIKSNHRFKLEMIKHLTCAYLYGFAHCVIDRTPLEPPAAEDVLMGKFFDELKKNYRQSRSVRFYADKLCVTPGYLATATKRATGRTVSEWISKYVVLEAKALLNRNDISVQQISYRLNFPNQSFFGKCFKKATGHSPNEYRNQCKEKMIIEKEIGMYG